MTEFTPISATFGGVLIGLSAVLLLWLNGRIAGISGILNGVFARDGGERNWRLMFVVGLILSGFLYQLITKMPLASRSDFPLELLALAGLLVGIGTRMGSGCTSGHAVCGISRLSARSLVATATFMTTGMLATAMVRTITGSMQ